MISEEQVRTDVFPALSIIWLESGFTSEGIVVSKKLMIMLLCCLVIPAKAGCLQRATLETLSVVAEDWLRSDCSAPDWCEAADFNLNSKVDFTDFAIYANTSPTVLVNNGICNVSIHNIVVGTSAVQSYAAKQLQDAFTLATGATPAINPLTPAPIRINIGEKKRFNAGIFDSSVQAYTIRTTYNGDIELVGSSANAVLWAVDDFCDRVLGVSWPVANGTAVLRGVVRPNLSVEPLCIEESPDFLLRGWLIGDHSPEGTFYNENIVSWMGHNRASIKTTPIEGLELPNPNTYDRILERGLEPDDGSCHNFWRLVPTNTYFATHPEYFPLINGVRVPGSTYGIGNQLCVSNPDVKTIIITKIMSEISAYKNIKVFGVVPNDGGGGWCQCANCAVWDGDQAGTGVYSNRLIRLCNEVADWLHTGFPNIKIGTLAYSEFVLPPTINVSDNVQIYYCTGGRNYMKKLTDVSDTSNAMIMSRINGWLAKANNVALYEYYYTTGLESTWLPFSRTLVQEFPELKALGIKGISVETTKGRWPNYIANVAYTFARATWDTTLTYDQILTDYCVRRYGTASADMYSFYRLYEDSIYAGVPVLKMFGPAEQLYPPCFTSLTIASMESYLSSAEATVAGSSNVQNISAIAEDRERFGVFRRLAQDPASIPGIGPNLVLNPGAESGSVNWGFDIQNGADYTESISSINPHSGSKSFMIQCTGTPNYARWYQTSSCSVIPGHKYTGRLWIKVSGTGSWGEVWFYQGVNDGRLAFVDTGGQWQMIVAPEVIAESSSITIYINTFGPGTVEIDDCFLAELPAGY